MDIREVYREKILVGPVQVVYQPSVIRPLCRHPYYKHSKGCPNFGKRADCPPFAKLFTDLYEDQAYVVAVKFDFENYLVLKRQEHPDWTERALRNCLHWQGHLRSVLGKFCFELRDVFPQLAVVTNPEATGVNLTATCFLVGIELEWPPKRVVFQINLLAKPKV